MAQGTPLNRLNGKISIVGALLLAVLHALLFLAVAALDPFHITSGSAQLSERIVYRLGAALYPGHSGSRDSCPESSAESSAVDVASSEASDCGQDRVTVVLITDATLAGTGEAWPMSYEAQAKIVRRILQRRPQALYIDLLYSYERGGSDAMAPLIGVLNAFGCKWGTSNACQSARQRPVLVAALDPRATESFRAAGGYDWGILPKILDVAVPAVVAWHGYEDAYPLTLPCPATGEKAPSPAPDTPATWLYRVSRGVSDTYSTQPLWEGRDCRAEPEALLPPLSLVWGLYTSNRMFEVGKRSTFADCLFKEHHNSVLAASKLLLTDFFGSAGDQGMVNPCPYTDTLDAGLLANDESANSPSVLALIQNRIVILGAGLAGAGGQVTTPTGGQLPAVYSHAMAVDNLLTYGDQYLRKAPRLDVAPSMAHLSWLPTVGADTVVECALILLAFVMVGFVPAVWTGQLQSPRGGPHVGEGRCRLHAYLLYLFIVFDVQLLLLVLLRWEPINWVGLVLVGVVLFPDVLRACLEPVGRRLDQFFARLLTWIPGAATRPGAGRESKPSASSSPMGETIRPQRADESNQSGGHGGVQ